jgi:hypothetical protein
LDFTCIHSLRRGARAAGAGRKLAIGTENDDKILTWILQQQEMHIPVSRQAIQDYARDEFGEEFGHFKVSDGWLEKLLSRHHLSLRCRTSMSQKLLADLEDKVTSFVKFIKDMREENEFDDEFIVNMDETPVFLF